MKIHRVEIEGFGPFRERQLIDLDAYTDDGLFLISGRTGTGKSSILDAVCFALYGSVPRYDEGEKRLRSDHAQPDDPTEVAIEFTSGARTWRIERSPDFDRPKKRGTGTTRQKAEARMLERIDGVWVGRAARPVDVGHLVDEVVGLTQQQFLQVILLAQGRFARFLLAKNDERQALLRTLFGTKRFSEYEADLLDRSKAAQSHIESELQALTARLEEAERIAAELPSEHQDVPEAEPEALRTADRIEASETAETDDAAAAEGKGIAAGAEDDSVAADAPLERDVTTEPAGTAGVDDDDGGERAPVDPADRSVEWRIEHVARVARRALQLAAIADDAERAASAALAETTAVHDEKKAQRDKQERLAAAQTTLAALDERESAITEQREEHRAAQRAETVRGAADAAERAVAAVREAAEAVDAKRAHWAALGRAPGGSATPGQLDDFAQAAQRRIGAWEPLNETETRLAGDEASLEQLRADEARIVDQLAALDERLAEMPDARERSKAALAVANTTAAEESVRRAAVEGLEKQTEAARRLRELTEAYVAATAAFEAARQQKARAESALDALHRHRIDDMAGELAETLVDGDACVVCGSHEHPSPAERKNDPVTPEAIDAADAERAAASAAYEAANDARNAAQRTLGEAEAASGGWAVDELETELAAARDALDAAQRAAHERDRLSDELTALENETRRLGDDWAALTGQRSGITARIDSRSAELQKNRALLTEARGEHATVADRIADEQDAVDRATAFAAAQRALATAEATSRDAADGLRAAASDAGFADADAARDALRDAARRDALEQVIRQHDDAVAAARSTLAELESEQLPAEPIDLAATRAAADAARESWEAAVKASATAQHRAGALAEASERAASAHARIAQLAAKADAVRRLADTVAGRAPNAKRMKLETFVLAAELEEIVAAANVRLAEMSAGRYRLEHSDALAARGAASGLGLAVMDRFTGRARPPHSLSGGETFLASLALALGLAEVVTNRAGGIRLDTLFIDEGFGSLDAETLDVAMRTLDELRQGGRTVGVISHVETMKEQIPAQLRVVQTSQGWSRVAQDVLTPA